MAQDSETQNEAGPPITRSAMLLASYAAILGWLFYEQSTSWPHQGSWALVAYVVLCPGVLFQGFSLAYARLTGRALARRAPTRVVTIPLGILLAAFLADGGSELAMGGFERAYAPFVAQVGAGLAEPCGGGAKYFAAPAVAAYNASTGSRPTANLSYDARRFVLAFPGGSIDIDGSTIYYDSAAQAWRRFHNDDEAARAVLGKLTEGLAACRLRPSAQ